MTETLEKAISEYIEKYGHSEYEHMGFDVFAKYYGEKVESGVPIETLRDEYDIDPYIEQKLIGLNEGELVNDSGYHYGKNIVRTKDGWDVQIRKDIDNFIEKQIQESVEKAKKQ